MTTEVVCIRSPEKNPELFVQDSDGRQIVVKLTTCQLWKLVLTGLTALRYISE